MTGLCLFFWAFCSLFASSLSEGACSNLLTGQYWCAPPVIDEKTQEPVGCNVDGLAKTDCFPLNGITCDNKKFNGSQKGFEKDIDCRYTNGYHYSTALGLSIFLGWLGVDRFYLGYPALGLLKLCTCGIFGIGAFFDFLLIALQVVLPADGSNYVIDLYGPKLKEYFINNATYYMQQPE